MGELLRSQVPFYEQREIGYKGGSTICGFTNREEQCGSSTRPGLGPSEVWTHRASLRACRWLLNLLRRSALQTWLLSTASREPPMETSRSASFACGRLFSGSSDL